MREFKKERHWSRFAEIYEKNSEYILGKDLLKQISDRLSKEVNLGEVVEFGCGTGYFTRVIAKNAKSILAADLSDEMLQVANKKLKNFENVIIKKLDCTESYLPSEGFDTVFMANLIHTIKNPDKSIKESHRILKKDGLLLISTYTAFGMNFFDKIKLGIKYLKKWGIPKNSKNNYSPYKLARLVEKFGFNVLENELIGYKTKSIYLKAKKMKI